MSQTQSADLSWRPIIPLSHTVDSWFTEAQLSDSGIQSSIQTHQKYTALLNNSNNNNNITINKEAPNRTKSAPKQSMVICQFCDKIAKRNSCFTPNCRYFFIPIRQSNNSKIAVAPSSTTTTELIDYTTIEKTKQNWPRYKALVSYDGTDYKGWQSQPTRDTIQDWIEWRLSSFFRQRIVAYGSGRTDAGVHANGQCFHFDIPPPKSDEHKMSDAESVQRLNDVFGGLPQSIQIRQLSAVPKSFHSRFDCVGKRYVYTIIQNERASPFECRYVWNIIRKDRKPALDIDAMQTAAQYLIGDFDFTPFSVKYRDKFARQYRGEQLTTVKQMRQILIVCNPDDTDAKSKQTIKISLLCNKFLYKMARSIVGSLVSVGLGKMEPHTIKSILEGGQRTKQVVTAPGKGLTLDTAFYDEQQWKDATQKWKPFP